MRALRNVALVALSALSLVGTADARSGLSDAQIKQRIIKQSIAEYPGNCPCPYNSADVTPAFHPAATRDRPLLSRRSAVEAMGGFKPAHCFSSSAANAAGVA